MTCENGTPLWAFMASGTPLWLAPVPQGNPLSSQHCGPSLTFAVVLPLSHTPNLVSRPNSRRVPRKESPETSGAQWGGEKRPTAPPPLALGLWPFMGLPRPSLRAFCFLGFVPRSLQDSPPLPSPTYISTVGNGGPALLPPTLSLTHRQRHSPISCHLSTSLSRLFCTCQFPHPDN